MDKQRHDVQLEPSSSVPIRDVALRIGQKQWAIGRCDDRRPEITVLIARHNDDEKEKMYICILALGVTIIKQRHISTPLGKTYPWM